MAGASKGICRENPGSGARCGRCRRGHACAPIPENVKDLALKFLALKRKDAPSDGEEKTMARLRTTIRTLLDWAEQEQGTPGLPSRLHSLPTSTQDSSEALLERDCRMTSHTQRAKVAPVLLELSHGQLPDGNHAKSRIHPISGFRYRQSGTIARQRGRNETFVK
ncbi:hypothetical protein VTK56DRAFT_8448 [Thermocarpiscus australiensis]